MENSNGGNTNVGSIGNSIKNERSSIEKDIHLLESYAGMTHKMTDNQGRPKLDQAIERVLLDYKKILKENEELKNQEETARKVNELLVERYSTSIPIQKVKEKIEEFKEEINQLRIERNVTYDSGIYRNQIKIDILQELLESEE